LRHIYSNLKKKGFYGLKLNTGFWDTSKAYMNLNYNIYTRDIGDMDIEAVKWLKNIFTKTWVRYMLDPGVNVDNTTNKLDKSFNN